MPGRTSLTSHSLIGVNLNLNPRKLLDKALKQIELKLLMASFGLISQ
jgi:putative transposase